MPFREGTRTPLTDRLAGIEVEGWREDLGRVEPPRVSHAKTLAETQSWGRELNWVEPTGVSHEAEYSQGFWDIKCRSYSLANAIHLQIGDEVGIGENIGQAGTRWEPFAVTMDKRRIYVFFRCWKPRRSPMDGKPRDMPLHW